MNKKGFTLVELLAVIAILAILVIIALPNVLDLFSGAKESTFKVEVQNLFDSAERAYVKSALGGYNATYEFGSATGKTQLDIENKDGYEYCVVLNSNGTVKKLQMRNSEFSYNGGDGAKKTDVTENTIIAKGETGYLDAVNCN